MRNPSDPLESGCQFQVSHATEEPLWDQFVARCPGGHHEQTSLWAQVKSHYGWTPLRLLLKRGNQIVAGAQILERRLLLSRSVGYITQGPLFSFQSLHLRQEFFQELNKLAKTRRYIQLVVIPPYNGQDIISLLANAGYRCHPEFLPPSGLLTATLLLDLRDNLDTIFAQMRPRTRRETRRGLNKGVVVRMGDWEDLATFRELMLETCRRRGVAPTPPQPDFFEKAWRIFRPHGYVRLFLAEYRGETVSAGFVFPFGDCVRIWKFGWSGKHPRYCPNQVLYWKIADWAKSQGYRHFDLVSIDRRAAEAIKRGEAVQEKSTDGATFFKLGFGGQVLLVPGAYSRGFNLLSRILLLAANNFLASSALTRGARALWQFLSNSRKD